MFTPATSASSTSEPEVIMPNAFSTHVTGPPFLYWWPFADEMTTGCETWAMTAGARPKAFTARPEAAEPSTNARRDVEPFMARDDDTTAPNDKEVRAIAPARRNRVPSAANPDDHHELRLRARAEARTALTRRRSRARREAERFAGRALGTRGGLRRPVRLGLDFRRDGFPFERRRLVVHAQRRPRIP